MTPAFGLALGGRVGPYVITDELGEGGMGVVYRAVHTLLNRPAAIKVLRPELGGHTLALDRFLNEARATTAIRHPGIVEVYDYGHTESGCAFIAMELLEGQTLGARLAARGKLAVAEALVIARRIAAPLAVAHEAGIVHRDLKPDNVFLIRDPEGGALDQIKLLDFGIAKLESSVHRTTLGVVLGTPAYMAPEQCRGIECDSRADLYALGCILFELVTGAPPFGRTGSMSDVMAAHMHAPVPPLPAIDHQIARLISRLLAKSPGDRPRSAVEVVFEIDRYLAAVPAPAPGPRTTLRLAIATATGLALTLASLGAWYRSRRAPRSETAQLPPVFADGSVIVDSGTKPLDAPPMATAATIAVDAAILAPADSAQARTVEQKKPRKASDEIINSGDLTPPPTINADTTVTP
ncbi:MAG: serine/threonine-protein kinase [Kofleriaceae bacterium]